MILTRAVPPVVILVDGARRVHIGTWWKLTIRRVLRGAAQNRGSTEPMFRRLTATVLVVFALGEISCRGEYPVGKPADSDLIGRYEPTASSQKYLGRTDGFIQLNSDHSCRVIAVVDRGTMRFFSVDGRRASSETHGA